MAIANFETQTKKIMTGFNQALDGKKWFVGDDVSLADIVWFCSSYPLFANVLDAEFRKTIPHAVAHFEKLEGLAEFKAVAGDPVKFPETAPVIVYEETKAAEVPKDLELTYFGIRGRAETLRLFLEATGTKYTEINPKDWAKEKVAGLESGALPFGQLPHLKWGDVSVVQTHAILRFLGKKLNACGSSEAEAAQVDQMVEAAQDLRLPYLRLVYGAKLEDKAKEEHKKVAVDHLKNVEAALKRSKTAYIASKELSIADATWYDVIDNHLRIYSDILDSYPLLKAWYEKFGALPGIKAYVSDKRHKVVNANQLG
jgi:glutathione S-transferase